MGTLVRVLTVLAAVSLAGCASSEDEQALDTGEAGNATEPRSTDATSQGGPASSGGQTTGDPIGPPVLDDCITDATPGEHVYSCGDLTFDVTVPASCIGSACGLILDVHGFTMSGKMQDNNTGMRALAGPRGYIVVQPNANPLPPQASWTPATDDEKIVDFTQRVIAAFHIDENRVHFTGFSQGGFMSWRMICGHADLFASVAPAAACPGSLEIEDCTFEGDDIPSAPIPILYMHGTDDALVDYACAEPRRDAVVAHFGMGDPQVVSEDEQHRWTRYTNSQGAVFEFISHDYAAGAEIIRGHCYPGANDPADVEGQLFPFHCEQASAFNWGEAALAFFEAHPKA